jgi:hypothetical protein
LHTGGLNINANKETDEEKQKKAAIKARRKHEVDPSRTMDEYRQNNSTFTKKR